MNIQYTLYILHDRHHATQNRLENPTGPTIKVTNILDSLPIPQKQRLAHLDRARVLTKKKMIKPSSLSYGPSSCCVACNLGLFIVIAGRQRPRKKVGVLH